MNRKDFMRLAIDEGKLGISEGGRPIACVLVKDGEVVARAHNRVVQDSDPTSHTEIDEIDDDFYDELAGAIYNNG